MSYIGSTRREQSAIVIALGKHQIVSGPIDDPAPTVAFIEQLIADHRMLAVLVLVVHCGQHGEGLARTKQEGGARLREYIGTIHAEALGAGALDVAEAALPGGQLDAIDWSTVAGLVARVGHEAFRLDRSLRRVVDLEMRAAAEAARNGGI